MSKTKLVDAIEGQFESRSAATRAVDAVFDGVERVVRGGDRVTVNGFGSFIARDRKATTVRNIRTGVTVAVPAKRALGFKSKVQL